MKSNQLQPLARNVKPVFDQFVTASSLQPRPYQARIIQAAIRHFAGISLTDDQVRTIPASSVLIESPTGSGKTVMGLAVAKLIQQATGCRIGWVAMRRNLLAQAQAENQSRGFDVDMQMISMFEKNPPEVDLLIVDEAQHDAATSMANLHSQIQPRWTLGLSATPYRTDRIKLCFDQIIRDAGIAALIADGYLSQYLHYTVPQYTPSFLADLITQDQDRWGKSLVFFHKRQECKQLQVLLESKNITCDVVTAISNRQRQLEAFMDGKTQVLINMAILTEGFDCPDLKTVFCRPSGKGCTIQMAGRVLRKSKDGCRKQVVQCRNTKHPMMRTAMPSEQYLWTDQGWRSIQANRQLDEMTMMARRKIASASAQLPSLVAIHRNRNQNSWFNRD